MKYQDKDVMMNRPLLGFLLWFSINSIASAFSVSIESADGRSIHAESYFAKNALPAPVIVLFHEENSNHGEYQALIPALQEMGYHCLAVDLRNGGEHAGIINQTEHAMPNRLKQNNSAALADIIGALRYVRKLYPGVPTIAFGASTSAALSLVAASNYPALVDGVIALSPGEYFEDKGKTWVQHAAGYVKQPTFVSSAEDEHALWRDIFKQIPTQDKVAYLPTGASAHGIAALTLGTEESGYTWEALSGFLQQYFPS